MTALTIGMATYNDFDVVYLTIKGFQLYHDLTDVELVVIDNYGCKLTPVTSLITSAPVLSSTQTAAT